MSFYCSKTISKTIYLLFLCKQHLLSCLYISGSWAIEQAIELRSNSVQIIFDVKFFYFEDPEHEKLCGPQGHDLIHPLCNLQNYMAYISIMINTESVVCWYK